MTVPPFPSRSSWRSAVALMALAMLLLAAIHGHASPERERECGSAEPGLHCEVCDAFLGGSPPAPAPQPASPERLQAADLVAPVAPVLTERRERGGSRAPPARA